MNKSAILRKQVNKEKKSLAGQSGLTGKVTSDGPVLQWLLAG